MIRAIIFDCFGVLYGGSLRALIEQCPPERIEELRDVNKQVDYGFIEHNEYIAGVAAILGKSPSDIEIFLSQKHVRNDQLLHYVVTLKADYKIGLLSNVGLGGIEHLFPFGEREKLFDAVVLSHEEHMTKPHPRIFELAAERLGVAPSECVMIDDLAINCEGAEAIGMQTIQHIRNTLTIQKLEAMLANA